MISRYTRPEMGALWSEEAKFARWLDVEIAHCRALNKKGLLPDDALAEIVGKAHVDVERVLEIERETHHDMIAFLEDVSTSVGPAARFIHLGLTSTDVVDTAQALTIRRAVDLILAECARFSEALRARAIAHRDLVCLGRTHGVHAEATTFGLKFAVWWDEMRRNRARIEAARTRIGVGKLSGAVGTYAETTPELEEIALSLLGLERAATATQVLQRDLHAEIMTALAVLAGTLEKIAVEIRHLQRTEVAEAAEPFGRGQKGSSAMPHKRNPIICERVCGLARVIRNNAGVALENQALWHERDISHSSAERIILPDSFILTDTMLSLMTRVVDGLTVDAARMAANLDSSRGLIHSSKILAALMRAGVERVPAYRWVQAASMTTLDSGGTLLERLSETPFPGNEPPPLDRKELESLCDHDGLLRSVQAIFKRIDLA